MVSVVRVCVTLVFACLSSCDRLGKDQCFLELQPGGDARDTRTSGGYLYSLCDGGQFTVWSWSDLEVPPIRTAVPSWDSVPRRQFGAVLADKAIITVHSQYSGDPCLIVFRDLQTSDETHRWDLGRQWEYRRIRPSRNGRFCVLVLEENLLFAARAPAWDDFGDYRIGVVQARDYSLRWAGKIREYRDGGPRITNASVSEDGRLVACVGTYNDGWADMMDVDQNTILWQRVVHGPEVKVPSKPWTVNFNDCAFSPDGGRLYVAGNTGLFCFDVQTGKILQQWGSEGRLMSVEASPDGRWVATGMALPGDVFLYDLQTNRLARRIRTGQIVVYGLAFSPDSQLLATSGRENTNVKIWKLAP